MNAVPLPWTQVTWHPPGAALTLWRLPGVAGTETATALLARTVRHLAGERVLVAGPGLVGSALWAAVQGAHVTCWTDSRAEALSLEASFRAQRLPLPTVHVCADLDWAAPDAYDTVLLHLPRGSELQGELLALTRAVLRPEGRCYAVGATQEGVRGALGAAQRLFGRAGVVARKAGYHVIMAMRPAAPFPVPQIAWSQHAVIVDGKPAIMESCPGVFAAGRLDEGAAALIAGMGVDRGQRVLDLGCGAGLVALAALRRGAQVIAVDVSARAVEATRRTLRANGFAAAEVLLSYGAERVTLGSVDVVVTNPPFHTGHEVDFGVVRLFINDAARSLRAGGQLFLVANAFLPYEKWLAEVFRAPEVAYANERFRVWCASR